jgi:hypothetical protein
MIAGGIVDLLAGYLRHGASGSERFSRGTTTRYSALQVGQVRFSSLLIFKRPSGDVQGDNPEKRHSLGRFLFYRKIIEFLQAIDLITR